MRLSAKGEYGVRAMISLTLEESGGPVPLRNIAEKEGISEQFLEQIFLELRRAELIKSVRGPRGGYLLARNSAEISIGEIVEALEGPIAPVDCLAQEGSGRNRCEHVRKCLSIDVWIKLRDAVKGLLDGISLADLCFGEKAEKTTAMV
ncbi:MAG: Rrf2 family transcriptional regulator [Firmicutes bacterium]|nr:Rrf2 family transcriptional regulator [Bacillota bacterium]